MSDLLPAIRALAAFDPPKELPPCDLDALARVLTAHGLAPMASYHIEHTRLAIGLPEAFREALLAVFQGTVNDNVLKLVTLRNALKDAPDVPVVLLDGAAYVDWLYPHMAWRPVSDLRLAVRGADGPAFAKGTAAGLKLERTEHDGRVAVFSDGHIEVALQEGLWPGGAEDDALFSRAVPYRAFGQRASRPSPEEAVLCACGDLGQAGLWAPLLRYTDFRELVRLEQDAGYVKERAASLGLSRALFGACELTAWFFPEVAEAAARLKPTLGSMERAALQPVIDAARDPAKLSHLRGTEEAAKLLVAP
jgi:hypothetical protein